MSPLAEGAFVPWSQLCPVSDYPCDDSRYCGPQNHQAREDSQVRGASVNHDFYILAIDIGIHPPVQSTRKLGSRDSG